jgi:hypothetical protein
MDDQIAIDAAKTGTPAPHIGKNMSDQMPLIDSVKTGAAGIASAAMIHYRELLAGGESLSKTDRERLIMAAHVLGKNGDEVAQDHATMQNALNLRDRARQVSELEHQAGVCKDRLSKQENSNLIEKRRLDDLLTSVKSSATAAEHDAVAARDAQRELHSLKDANPDLLGGL